MTYQESLPEPLKEQIADAIVDNFLKGDVVDALMGLAYDETKPFINSDNQDLFCEVSGMVGYKIAKLIHAGASLPPADVLANPQSTAVPSPAELFNLLASKGWRQIGVSTGVFIMENTDFSGRQMVFPTSMSAPDYVESAQSVLQKLSLLPNTETN